MNIKFFSKTMLLVSFFCWSACTDSEPGPAEVLIVDNEGKMTLFGKEVSMDNLKTALLDSLVQMSSIPEELPISFGDELLMGIRGEVRTIVSEAIEAAKTAAEKPVVVGKTFYRTQGTDCDQPDTLRTACAIIHMDYPVVYFKEPALHEKVDQWVAAYLTGMLAVRTSDEADLPIPTLEEAAAVFFNNHEDVKDSAMYGSFTAECNYEELFVSARYLSLEIDGYTFQGGAHGSPTATVATFDIHSGRRLVWEELVKDTAALQVLAEQKFREERAEIFQDGFEFDDIFVFKLPNNFALVEEGIYFHYLAYEVGPYAIGSTTFLLPYSEIGDLLLE